MEIIIGIIVGILSLLGIKKFKPSQLPDNINDDRVEELEDKLDKLEEKEEELKKKGSEDLTPSQVVDFWKKD